MILPGPRGHRRLPAGEFRLNRWSPQADRLLAWYPLIGDRGGSIIRNYASPQGKTTFTTPLWTSDPIFSVVPNFNNAGYIDTGLTGFLTGLSPTDAVTLFCGPSQIFSVSIWGKVGAGSIGSYFGKASGTNALRTFHFAINPADPAPSPDPFVWVRGTLTEFSLGHQDGLWHHYAFTWDGSTLRFYVDGRFLQNVTVGAAVEETTQRIFIGARTNTPAFFLTGQLRDFRIANKVWTAGEVWQQYDPGSRFDLYLPLPDNIYLADAVKAPVISGGEAYFGNRILEGFIVR